MFQDTRPAELGADGQPDAWGEFRVGHPGEVLALLRQLRDGTHPVNLNAPDGHALTTTLWAVDDTRERLNFSVDARRTDLDAIVEADELLAVAYLDSVKLQFELPGVTLVRSAQTAALQTGMPREMFRFQRRNAYRVRTLERTSPTAHLRHPSIPDMMLSLRVIDISIGGCALFVPHEVPPLQPGTRVEGARIELDIDTGLALGLQLQHVSAITPGQRGTRIGCEWVDMNPAAERALQRYIDQTQKRRRLMVLD
ncbi:MAG: flagellar brake protein [Rubrivivax sp.]|nr:flagellar brake protein [Rubrivivax sp.]